MQSALDGCFGLLRNCNGRIRYSGRALCESGMVSDAGIALHDRISRRAIPSPAGQTGFTGGKGARSFAPTCTQSSPWVRKHMAVGFHWGPRVHQRGFHRNTQHFGCVRKVRLCGGCQRFPVAFMATPPPHPPQETTSFTQTRDNLTIPPLPKTSPRWDSGKERYPHKKNGCE